MVFKDEGVMQPLRVDICISFYHITDKDKFSVDSLNISKGRRKHFPYLLLLMSRIMQSITAVFYPKFTCHLVEARADMSMERLQIKIYIILVHNFSRMNSGV